MPDSPPVKISLLDGTPWVAVMVKPRCEKTVARHCAKHGIACYLPLRCRAERYQRRTVLTLLPMFPGYLFVQLDPARQTTLIESHKIVRILNTNAVDEAALVDELRALQRMEQTDGATEIEVMPEIVAGEPVLITGGPLAGVTGIVERRVGSIRVAVNIEILGLSVSVDLDVGDMEAEPSLSPRRR